MNKIKLILENGDEFIGEGFGSNNYTIGEVVFTTGMTGYQETMTDPSFNKQIIVFTYPLIGNYGINASDIESLNPKISGVIVNEYAKNPSHWQMNSSIDEYLKKHNIPGLSGIDTRALVKLIRSKGCLRGVFCNLTDDKNEILKKLKSTVLANHVAEVSTIRPYNVPNNTNSLRIVVVDYGMKKSILKELAHRNCDVTIVPHNTKAKDILDLNPDGILLSNGPGDPKELVEEAKTVKELMGKVPVFGICLGHQLFALANGATTYKLPFGHRGANHPVKDLASNRVFLTSQNHGYAVDKESLANTQLEISHLALNDNTIEGLKHKEYKAFSVQYHPESSPGPDDNSYLFDQFLTMVSNNKQQK